MSIWISLYSLIHTPPHSIAQFDYKNSCQVFKKLRYFVLSAIESIGSIKKNVEDGSKDNNQVIRKLSIDKVLPPPTKCPWHYRLLEDFPCNTETVEVDS